MEYIPLGFIPFHMFFTIQTMEHNFIPFHSISSHQSKHNLRSF